MQCLITVLVVLGLATTVSSKITCYRGINIIMPGNANFSQSMASLGCNNANYCLRAFGKFNGQDGWFSTCASDDTCSSYPACTTVNGGTGNYATSYTSCCCNSTLCNDLSFTGPKDDGTNTTTTAAPSTDSTVSVSVGTGTSTVATTTTSSAEISATAVSLIFFSLLFLVS